MPDYESVRWRYVRDAVERWVEQAAAPGRYRRGEPTIVLLPGGMGSQLDRSPAPFDRGHMELDRFAPVWLSFRGLAGLARSIRMERDGDRADLGRHVIVPNGPLRFAVVAYDYTQRWFEELGWNFLALGYDWRRRMDEAASLIEHALAYYRDRVQRLHGEDPLPRTTLVAHSQGGLPLVLFLHLQPGSGLTFHRAITAGSPFYGTSSGQQRFFLGQEPLNRLFGPADIVEVAASLPGPYSLMMLPRSVYTQNEAFFRARGLTNYPVSTFEDAARACDPYDPANLDRWPQKVCDRQYLDRARELLGRMAEPLPGGLRDRFFNIVSTSEPTFVGLRWKRLAAGFTAAGPDPFEPVLGPGDGTVPSWSARHIDCPNEIVVPGQAAHEDLLETEFVLKKITELAQPAGRARPADPAPAAPVPSAPSREVAAVLEDARQDRLDQGDPRLARPDIQQGIIKEIIR